MADPPARSSFGRSLIGAPPPPSPHLRSESPTQSSWSNSDDDDDDRSTTDDGGSLSDDVPPPPPPPQDDEKKEEEEEDLDAQDRREKRNLATPTRPANSLAAPLPSYKDQVRDYQPQHPDDEEEPEAVAMAASRLEAGAGPSDFVFASARVLANEGDLPENVVAVNAHQPPATTSSASRPYEEKDASGSSKKYLRPLLIGLAILLIAGGAVGGVCGAGLCGGGGDGSQDDASRAIDDGSPSAGPPTDTSVINPSTTTTESPTQSPTSAPTGNPFSGAIVGFVNSVTLAGRSIAYPPPVIAPPPEELALQWVIESDPIEHSTGPLTSQLQLMQRYALATLYFSTAGTSWTESTGWLSEGVEGEDECSWFGIVCNDRNRVTSLDLGENNLDGVFPADLALLELLTTLDLSLNPNLGGSLPLSLDNLQFLTILSIHDCAFSGELPDTIGDLSSLTNFNVYVFVCHCYLVLLPVCRYRQYIYIYIYICIAYHPHLASLCLS